MVHQFSSERLHEAPANQHPPQDALIARQVERRRQIFEGQARRAGQRSLGLAVDEQCGHGMWAYAERVESASPTMGSGSSAPQWISSMRPNRKRTPGLEILVDLSVLKGLRKAHGVSDVALEMEALRPALAWCSAANRLGVHGRFMVPTHCGVFTCQRAQIPKLSGFSDNSVTSRIMSYRPMGELPGAQIEIAEPLFDLADHFDPGFPNITRVSAKEVKVLARMHTADIEFRAYARSNPEFA